MLGLFLSKIKKVFLKQSNRKPNKISVDKGSEFYNAYFKKMVARQLYCYVFNT